MPASVHMACAGCVVKQTHAGDLALWSAHDNAAAKQRTPRGRLATQARVATARRRARTHRDVFLALIAGGAAMAVIREAAAGERVTVEVALPLQLPVRREHVVNLVPQAAHVQLARPICSPQISLSEVVRGA